jgi:hypothetical protein
MRSGDLKREVVIAAVFFGCGFLLLPLAVYWVGTEVVGEYAGNGGLLALAEQIWADFLALQPAAWVLVLCPYLVLLLIRLIRRTWRTPPV